MKLKRDDLLPALDALMPIAGRRTTLPALNCIRLEGNNGHLSLRASNLDCDSTINIPCTGKIAPVCVPARVLHAATDGDADTITFEPEEKLRLRVIGNGEARLACLDPEEFVAEPDKSGKAIGVNPLDLARAIKSVAWAASLPDALRLPQVYVYLSAKEIHCIGTDKKTFASIRLLSIAADCKFMVPEAQAGMFSEALTLPGAQLFVGEKNCSVEHDSGRVFVRLAEGGGPDPRRVMESPKEPIGEVAVVPWITALSTCCELSSDKDNYTVVRTEFEPNGIDVLFNGGANGYETKVPGSFEKWTCTLDARRAVKALKQFDAEKVKLFRWGDMGLLAEAGEMSIGLALMRNQ